MLLKEHVNSEFSAKFVDFVWAAKFLSSNDNAEQEQFLQWVAVCMFQQLKYGKHIPVATTLETVIDDSNNIVM